MKIAVAMDGKNRFAFGTAAQTKTTLCKVSSEDSGGHAPSLNSTHYRVPDHCCTSIIVRINLNSSDLTYHLKTLVEEAADTRSMICNLQAAAVRTTKPSRLCSRLALSLQ